MATKSYNPTANSFELLANAELQEPSHERRTKAPRKEKEEEQTGAIPTPAAKAQARQAAAAKAKEATKQAQQAVDDADFTQTQSSKDQPKNKKLSREQYLADKKKGIPPAVDEDGFRAGRRQRERKEITQGTNNDSNGTRVHRGGNNERGGHRGGERGGRGGRGGARGPRGPRHEDEGTPSASPAGERSKAPRSYQHQPPTHGRDYDKRSGMKTGRNAGPKKGGAGGGVGTLGTERDDLEAQTGIPDAVDASSAAEQGGQDVGWGDAPETEGTAAESDKPAEGEADAEAEAEAAELSLEAYRKLQAEKLAALAEKVGAAPTPRELEKDALNLAGFKQIRKYDADQTVEQKKESERKAKAEARKGEKVLDLGEVFAVHHSSPSSGGYRGGRGRGRGRGRGGDRDRGDRGDRGDRDHGDRDHGDRDHGDGGERRSRGRGDGQSRGRGRGRGAPRMRGHIDSRQFPDLGAPTK